MSEWRVGCWLVIGAVCSVVCVVLFISVATFALKVPFEVANRWGQATAVGIDKGLEFLFWLISALFGWLLKSIFPFM
jgi:hypothetical protein